MNPTQKPPSDGKIRVMIVEDHRVMREGLRALLASQPDMAVVADAEDGPAALRLIGRAKPDVVLMDSSMPGMSGVEATRQIKKRFPKAKVIGLTLYEQPGYLEEMREQGAGGYVLKLSASAVLIEAVRTVAAGGTFFDPAVPRAANNGLGPEPARPAPGLGGLCANELAVVKLLAEGQTNAEVAAALELALSAVETHRTAALEKLGVRTRAELVRLAAQQNWLPA